jgi:acyl-CoA synthetase (AMP-forming)/AMP-acid ligase II
VRPIETLPALLMAGGPDDPALVEAETGQTHTFAGLELEVSRIAGLLATVGVRRGDRVAIVLPSGPAFIFSLLAVTTLGATAAPLNPAYTRDEFVFYLKDLEPRLLLVPASDLKAARAAAGDSTAIVEVVADAHGRLALLDAGQPIERETPFETADPADVALLLHTSGTTSRPKQVPLLQSNLTASALSIARHYALSSSDVSYSAMPLFHVHGLVASTLAALVGGGSVVMPQRFGARQFWRQARALGVTWFSAGPTLHQMILDRADSDGPPSTLRFVRSCSSPLSPALMQRAEDVYGVPMLEAYGMTEASHQISSNPLPPAKRVPGSVGVPTGIEIRTVDADGRDISPGEAGEVAIRGPGVTAGYLKNPEANRDAFFDGWFRTGDLGVLADGYLRLEGRLKEMILRGGENVSPHEVEAALLLHPAVREAVCFSVADEKYGENVGAAVTVGAAVAEAELVAHCRERLAPFKVPSVIYVVDEIPRTPTGKVQRRRVGELLAPRRP